MLTGDDRRRIEEEEQYRADVRSRLAREVAIAANSKSESRFLKWLAWICGGVVFVYVMLLAILDRGSNAPVPGAPVGERLKFRGAAGDTGTGAGTGNPYFDVTADGMTIQCYYVDGRAPERGTFVTVAGRVTDSNAGLRWVKLRPCAIVEP